MTKKNLYIFFTTTIFITILSSSVNARMVSVANNVVNMRSGPGKNYQVVWELGKGYPLKILKSKGNWLQVIDYENDKGWIYKKLVNRTPHLIVKNKIINIRSGPGKNYKIIRQAKKGVVFRTLERKKGWVKAHHKESNLTGWIKRSLLWGW